MPEGLQPSRETRVNSSLSHGEFTALKTAFAAGALAAFVLADATAARAQDATMTCPQITQAVAEQNAIIQQQAKISADLASARADPGDADPAIAQQKSRIKSDRATKRASQLVALGRQKHCFK